MAFFKKKVGKFKKKDKKKLPPKKNQCRFCRRGKKPAEGAPGAPAVPAVPAAPAVPSATGPTTVPTLPPLEPARVDYKDIRTLQKLCTSQGKLFSRKRSGNCAKHQRQFRQAAKRARFLALLPYIGR
ncbi:MAG TPA: 30S ribosomal protein S18 [Planctomycetota bacterium]|nr:30S ribosomal protein S18 [Planctomycetota bacterium]